MKRIYLSIIACSAIILGLCCSCNDTMDDKDEVESGWSHLPNPTATVSVTESTYCDALLKVTISELDNVIEYGVQYSKDKDFVNGKYVAASSSDVTETDIKVTGLDEKTTYYLRPYVITRSNITIFGEPSSLTTAAAPIFALEGTYTATYFSRDEDGSFVDGGTTYKVEIAFVAGSNTEVNIINLWDGGETISGTYDAETGIITVGQNQLLYTDPTYGECFLKPVNNTITNYQPEMSMKFVSLGGSLTTGYYSVVCSLGSFGFFYTTMTHD